MHAHLTAPEPTWHDLRAAHDAAEREDAARSGRVEADGQREMPWTVGVCDAG